MDEQKIIAKVSFSKENGTGGVQGFEEGYDSKRSILDYCEDFKNRTKKANPGVSYRVDLIQITKHTKDGTFQRDSNGNRINKILYKFISSDQKKRFRIEADEIRKEIQKLQGKIISLDDFENKLNHNDWEGVIAQLKYLKNLIADLKKSN